MDEWLNVVNGGNQPPVHIYPHAGVACRLHIYIYMQLPGVGSMHSMEELHMHA